MGKRIEEKKEQEKRKSNRVKRKRKKKYIKQFLCSINGENRAVVVMGIVSDVSVLNSLEIKDGAGKYTMRWDI